MSISFLQQPQDYTGLVGDTVQLSCEAQDAHAGVGSSLSKGTTDSFWTESDWDLWSDTWSISGSTLRIEDGGSSSKTAMVAVGGVPLEGLVCSFKRSCYPLMSSTYGTRYLALGTTESTAFIYAYTRSNVLYYRNPVTESIDSVSMSFTGGAWDGGNVTTDISVNDTATEIAVTWTVAKTGDDSFIHTETFVGDWSGQTVTQITMENGSGGFTHSVYELEVYSPSAGILPIDNSTPSITYDLLKDGESTGDTVTTSSVTQTFELTDSQVEDSGEYSIVANDTVTEATSELATVTINPLMSFKAHPQDYSGTVGDIVSLSCEVENAVVISGCPIGKTFKKIEDATVDDIELLAVDGFVSAQSSFICKTIFAPDNIRYFYSAGNLSVGWHVGVGGNPDNGFYIKTSGTGGATQFIGYTSEMRSKDFSVAIDQNETSASVLVKFGEIVIVDEKKNFDAIINIDVIYTQYGNDELKNLNALLVGDGLANECEGDAPSITYALLKDGAPTGDTVTTSSVAQTFELTDSQVEDSGDYTIQIDDTVTTLVSDIATVLIEVPSIIVVTQPQDYTGLVGDTVPLSCEVENAVVLSGCPVGNSFKNIGEGFDDKFTEGTYTQTGSVVIADDYILSNYPSGRAIDRVNNIPMSGFVYIKQTSGLLQYVSGNKNSWCLLSLDTDMFSSGKVTLNYESGGLVSVTLGTTKYFLSGARPTYERATVFITKETSTSLKFEVSLFTLLTDTDPLTVDEVILPFSSSQMFYPMYGGNVSKTDKTELEAVAGVLANECEGDAPSITYDLLKDGESTGDTITTSSVTQTFELTDAQVLDSGEYSIVANDTVAEATSELATVTINPLMSFKTHPQDYSGTVGDIVSLSCEVQDATVTGGCPIGNYYKELEPFDFSGVSDFNETLGYTNRFSVSGRLQALGNSSNYSQNVSISGVFDILTKPNSTSIVRIIGLGEDLSLSVSGKIYKETTFFSVVYDGAEITITVLNTLTGEEITVSGAMGSNVNRSIRYRTESLFASRVYNDVFYSTSDNQTSLPNSCEGDVPSITYDLLKDGESTGDTITTSSVTQTFELTDAQVLDSGEYSIVANDTVAEATSELATVTINPLMSFKTHPADYSGVVGDTVSLSCEVQDASSVLNETYYEGGTAGDDNFVGANFVVLDWEGCTTSDGGSTIERLDQDGDFFSVNESTRRTASTRIIEKELVFHGGYFLDYVLYSDANNRTGFSSNSGTGVPLTMWSVYNGGDRGSSVLSDLSLNDGDVFRYICTFRDDSSDTCEVNFTIHDSLGSLREAKIVNASLAWFPANSHAIANRVYTGAGVTWNRIIEYVNEPVSGASITYDLLKDGESTGDTVTTSSVTQTFELTDAQVLDSGDYTIIANDTVSDITSDIAVVTIGKGLVIVDQTDSITGKAGDIRSAFVSVEGGSPFAKGCAAGNTFENYEDIPYNTSITCTDLVSFSARYYFSFSNSVSGSAAQVITGFGINYLSVKQEFVRVGFDYHYELTFQSRIGTGSLVEYVFVGDVDEDLRGTTWHYDIDITDGVVTVSLKDSEGVEHTVSTGAASTSGSQTIVSGIGTVVWNSVMETGFLVAQGLPNDCTGEVDGYEYDWYFTDTPDTSIGDTSDINIVLEMDMNNRSITCDVVDSEG